MYTFIKSSYGLALAMVLISLVSFAGCSKEQNSYNSATAYTSINEIPGVTEEDIKAIEELRKKYDSFTFGALASMEAFHNENGEVSGYAAILCDWLTELFDIKFVPKLYEWGDIFPVLNADFTSGLTATEERKTKLGFLFTSAITERSTKYFRIAKSQPLSEIAKTRPLNLAFLEGSTTSKTAISKLKESQIPHKAFYINDYNSAYNMIKSGKADAFIDEMIVGAAFDSKSDVVMENFFPLIYEPVSLAAQKPDLEPVINIIEGYQKRHFKPFDGFV